MEEVFALEDTAKAFAGVLDGAWWYAVSRKTLNTATYILDSGANPAHGE